MFLDPGSEFCSNADEDVGAPEGLQRRSMIVGGVWERLWLSARWVVENGTFFEGRLHGVGVSNPVSGSATDA